MLRRAPKETDWQSELAARSAPVGGRLTVAASDKDIAAARAREGVVARRTTRVLWGLVRLLYVAAPAGTWIVGHGPLRAAIFGLWVCLIPLDLLAARRRKRAKERELEPTVDELVQYELRHAAHELRGFLERPPERGTYERWLTSSTNALEQFVPEVAQRWARPDRGSSPSGKMVSEAELRSRRERLLELYAEVATPPKVATLRSDLPQAPSARAITSS